jgi:23S rRNA (cytidine1920-2'-O)/16S rRNA (cytidine1409-2'-O)-methyltransferase
MPAPEPYVSRAGRKLAAALAHFAVQPAGWVCADFGSHVGGFVDCLLQAGAARVHAIEPGYGVLAYKLRRDARVVVHERSNALHLPPAEPCDLVTIDVGWTPQHLVLPAARRWLRPGGAVVSLVKPQYEAAPEELVAGVVDAAQLPTVLARCRADAREQGWEVLGELESPLRGHGGNVEYLWWLR